MTEIQARFLSDKQADFENKLLDSPALFGRYARKYMDAPGALDSFLEWCWNNREEAEG